MRERGPDKDSSDGPRSRAPFALLEASVIISGAGNGVSAVAIPWLVLERTGDPAAAGIVGAATALPILASSLFSGAIADTLGRRRTAVLADALSALSVAAIPLVDIFFGLDLALIVLLAAIGALFDPAGATSRETMLAEVAKRGGIRLERANGIHEAAWGTAYLIGPGIGGVLIAWVGAAGALWATAGAFLLSILTISLVRAPGVGRPEAHERPESILAGSIEGLVFVWHHRLLRTMVLIIMVVVAVYMPIEGVLLPVIFEAADEPQRLGVVLAAMSAGGIAGSLAYSLLAARLKRYHLHNAALLLASASILWLATVPPFGQMIVAGALAGFFWGPTGPLMNLVMQIHTPPAKRGRVMGVVMASYYAAGPLGYLLAGWLVKRGGVEEVFLGIGIAIVITAIVGVFMPALRALDDEGPYEAELQVTDAKPTV